MNSPLIHNLVILSIHITTRNSTTHPPLPSLPLLPSHSTSLSPPPLPYSLPLPSLLLPPLPLPPLLSSPLPSPYSPELPWLSTMPQTPALPCIDHHPLSAKPSRKPSIAFENVIAEELAETLLAIDMKYFRRITVSASCGRDSWLRLLMSVVMLSISRCSTVDWNNTTFRTRRSL